MDEYQLVCLTESSERHLEPESRPGQYEYEWLTLEGVRERDSTGES